MTFAPHDSIVPPEKVRPLRRREYDRLVALGMLRGENVELLYGRLVRMSPQGEPHVFSVTRLNKLLVLALGDRAQVRVQAPFGVSDVSEPEPDIAIVATGEYLNEHPKSAFLLIEVADSSLQDDRRIKAPLYAAAGVPEYWIVDVLNGAVEVHRNPLGDRYTSVERHGREAILTVPGFEDIQVPIAGIVP